jgi:hypothetical protein
MMTTAQQPTTAEAHADLMAETGRHLADLTDAQPDGTLAALRARITEIDPEWLATALATMRSWKE